MSQEIKNAIVGNLDRASMKIYSSVVDHIKQEEHKFFQAVTDLVIAHRDYAHAFYDNSANADECVKLLGIVNSKAMRVSDLLGDRGFQESLWRDGD
jgi:CRISPR/Cas system-associated endonuclease/helicase Cas3